MQARRWLALVGAVVFATGTWMSTPTLAQKKNSDRKRLTGDEKVRIQALSKLVDAVAAVQQSAPSDVTLSLRTHFLKGEGNNVYVPYTIGIDGSFASLPVAMYVRIVKQGASGGGYDQSVTTMRSWRNLMSANAGDKVDPKDIRNKNLPRDEYAFEDAYVFEPAADGRLSRAFVAPPGDYDIYVAMREKPDKKAPQPKTVVYKRQLSVPDLTQRLAVSSVIVADNIEATNEQIENEKQLEEPYSIAGIKITPVSTMVRSKSGELAVILWIYNEGMAANNRPDVEVQYNFYQRVDGDDKFFNRTTPQQFNAQTLPPGFNPAPGHQLIASQAVPLASFPEGDYRLEIKVLDKTTGRFVIRDVNFSVGS